MEFFLGVYEAKLRFQIFDTNDFYCELVEVPDFLQRKQNRAWYKVGKLNSKNKHLEILGPTLLWDLCVLFLVI